MRRLAAVNRLVDGRRWVDGAAVRLNDTDPSIRYAGFSYSSGRGLGDYLDDIHYASDNGSTITYTFVGTGIKAYGELNGDEGHFTAVLDQITTSIGAVYGRAVDLDGR